MSIQSLQHAIEQLRQQLEDPEQLDPEARAQLLGLLETLQQRLDDDPKPTLSAEQTLLAQFKTSLWEFEKNHPTFTTVVGRIMDSLNKMGI